MTGRLRTLAALATALAFTGCDIVGVDCTTQAVAGVSVWAHDAVDGEPVTEGLTGHLLQGDYAELMVVGSNQLYGAFERPGTYAVVVTAPGYQDWVRTDVTVEDGGCHVVPVEIRADMERSPSSP